MSQVSNDELPILGCRGSRYRFIARDNAPNKAPGTEDMFKSEWFSTPQEAVYAFETGPNRWMKWSYAQLIERCDGLRMWAHSLVATE